MLTITSSVGSEGVNQAEDVLLIQQALNIFHEQFLDAPLTEDGLYGDNTASAILAFQKKYLQMYDPDGRIDPDGKTIKKLASMVADKSADEHILFPLMGRPDNDYTSGMAAFGASRSNGRKHAGVDLYAEKGTPIRAIKDGVVKQSYPFYLGTQALEVDHGDMLIRYGEISHVANEIDTGVRVTRGQIIGYVGELVFSSGSRMSMLHFEAYKGTARGALTVRELVPYQRRSDLFDPTEMLNEAVLE